MEQDKDKEINFISTSDISKEDNLKHIRLLREIDLNAGWLGKVFGTGKNSAANVAGLILFSLIVVGLFLSFWNIQLNDYWKTILLPSLTLVLGYIFAKDKCN